MYVRCNGRNIIHLVIFHLNRAITPPPLQLPDLTSPRVVCASRISLSSTSISPSSVQPRHYFHCACTTPTTFLASPSSIRTVLSLPPSRPHRCAHNTMTSSVVIRANRIIILPPLASLTTLSSLPHSYHRDLTCCCLCLLNLIVIYPTSSP
jgi:hypothetical protein